MRKYVLLGCSIAILGISMFVSNSIKSNAEYAPPGWSPITTVAEYAPPGWSPITTVAEYLPPDWSRSHLA